MVSNPAADQIGLAKALGARAIASGFQGAPVDHYWPNGDFLEAILSSSFDWNGIRRYIVATENDSLNGVCMLLMLTNRAQIFADVRLLEPGGGQIQPEDDRHKHNGFIHAQLGRPASTPAANSVPKASRMKPF